MNEHYVSASELAQYVYCECCWIDKREGLEQESSAMERGLAEHEKLNKQVLRYKILRRVAIVLTIIGSILFFSQVILLFIYNMSLW